MNMKFVPMRLPRTGELDLEFDGCEIARSSSRRDNSPRWTEIVVYKTKSDKWVINIVGRSEVSGEINRSTCVVCYEAKDVPASMHKPDGKGGFYLSFPAKQVMRQLCEKFPEHRQWFDETERV